MQTKNHRAKGASSRAKKSMAGRALLPAGMAPLTAIATALVVLAPGASSAMEFDTGTEDVKIRFDNTVKYSAAWRVKDLDPRVAATTVNPNLDDGDRNFNKGMISNRLDLLSELDVQYRNVGARLSGAAWYDEVYNRHTDNNGSGVFNGFSHGPNEFADATRKLHGRKAEFLDAFVFGKFTPGDMNLNLKAGRFTQLYGESLFFGNNGIAAAQSSPDIIKLMSVPSSQFKEIMRPVGQLSANLQLNSQWAVGGYYQLEWRKARLPGAGSYFSMADFLDAGGEQVWAGPGQSFSRGRDLAARDSGQGGVQVKFKSGDWEFGGYAAQFHDKFPQFYFRPGVNPGAAPTAIGDYVLVYGEKIKVYGASASTVLGDTNVATEVSFRDNQPLVGLGNVIIDPTGRGNGSGNAMYPVGKTFHAQVSAISVLSASPLWQAASFAGELAFNRRLSITRNADQLDPHATRNAAAMRFIFQPEYFQVAPGVDLKVPIGVGYGLKGRTSINGMGFPPEHGGDVSIGVSADVKHSWQASLTYTHYMGRPRGTVDAAGSLTYGQNLKDRNFIALSVQRTF